MNNTRKLTEMLDTERHPGAKLGEFLLKHTNSPDYLAGVLRRFLVAAEADYFAERQAIPSQIVAVTSAPTDPKTKLSATQRYATEMASKLYELAYELNTARDAVMEGAPCVATFQAARLTLVAAFGPKVADAIHDRVLKTDDDHGRWALPRLAREVLDAQKEGT